MEKYIGGGLKQLPIDDRDFSFGSVFGVQLPPDENFNVAKNIQNIKDQGITDMCAAYAVVGASELQENIELSPLWQFAKIKQLIGDWLGFGSDLRTACKSATKYGSLSQEDSVDVLMKKDVPPHGTTDWRNYIANWNNWFSTNKAEQYKKQSFFTINGGKDTFDSIRSALWYSLQKNTFQAVITGCYWNHAWNYMDGGIIRHNPEGQKTPHAFLIIGQRIIDNEPFLLAQLSNGKEIGDQGFFYFSREIVNSQFTFGAYAFNDMPVSHAKLLNKWGLSARWHWFVKIVVGIKNYFSFFLQ